MSVLPPDYDSDPGRWQSWESPQDVHEMIAPELRGPVLDVGCGEGRLASLLGKDVSWIGVDSSPAQLAVRGGGCWLAFLRGYVLRCTRAREEAGSGGGASGGVGAGVVDDEDAAVG